VSAPDFYFYFIFLIFFNFKKSVHVSSHNCVTCQFVVVLFIFVQFSSDIRYFCTIQFLYSLFLFNLVPNFVKIEHLIFKNDIIISYF